MTTARKARLTRSALTVAGAVILAASGIFSAPMPDGMPVSALPAASLLVAVMLGGIQGAGSAGLFIIAGAAGLPVFPGRESGMAFIKSPAGGLVIAAFIASAAAGPAAGKPSRAEEPLSRKTLPRNAAAALLGFAAYTITASLWYYAALSGAGDDLTFLTALNKTALPSLPINLIGAVAGTAVDSALRPTAAAVMFPDDEAEARELMERMKKKKAFMDKITRKGKHRKNSD